VGATTESSDLRVEGLAKAYLDRQNRRGANAVDGVDFTVAEGQFYSLLGPSGCGKTTTLRCIAGLERPDSGVIMIGNRAMSSAGSRQFTPPHKRPIGMVFQSYAIWPHLSVFDNVAFPLRTGSRRRRPTSKEITQRVEETLAAVQLSEYIRRPATAMSGGQQQRLALARALVARPKILLLDEPLSNLDVKLRDAMRSELRSLQRRLGVTTLYVTHDQAEALSMSDRIAVMSGGKIVQEGAPREIYRSPSSQFVAGFIGESNFLDGTVAKVNADGTAVANTPAGALTIRSPEGTVTGDKVTLGIRPQGITTTASGGPAGVPPAGPHTALEGLVVQVLFLGEHLDYRVRVGDTELLVRQPGEFHGGDSLKVCIPASSISVFSESRGTAEISAAVDIVAG
jgi:iron(III) transport system ATP-binding protein